MEGHPTMPLVVRPSPSKGLLRVAALAAAVLAVSAPGAAAACSAPDLTQPFLDWGDDRWFVLAPGQETNNFTGTGWTLTGGASILTTQIADGSTRQVLDMPSGSTAASPDMCVDATYPMARTMVRNVVGGDGVTFYVSYANTKSWDKPKKTTKVQGKKDAWTLSDKVDTHPDKQAGWQIVRFTLVAGGKKSDFQLYNFYVDPYRH